MCLNAKYLGHLLRIIQYRIGQSPQEWYTGWQQEYWTYMDSKETALGLALLYPGFYFTRSGEKIFSDRNRCEVRGERSFDGDSPPRCDWNKLTGRACEFSELLANELDLPMMTTAKDHVWPYALGGKTIDANMVILCFWHNGMIKGADNAYFEHLITNYEGQHHTRWIDDNLSRMCTLMKGKSSR